MKTEDALRRKKYDFANYLERKNIREQTPAMIKKGKHYRILGDVLISEDIFNTLYPFLETPEIYPENPNKVTIRRD